mmetsp:Transcript_4077/g.11582  ORF Transcript_4077/g.11582 Transcript_4077/m.11582 type:complete len:139 (-) Transcript_4077:48-464(-)
MSTNPAGEPSQPSLSSTSSVTLTVQGTPTTTTPPTLHLVLQPRPQHHVAWTADTIDNEHLGKKKSKKCCIYRKQRAFGESSSESSGSDDGAARPPSHRKKRLCPFGQPAGGDGGGSGGGNGGNPPTPGAPSGSSSSSS